MLGVKFFNHIDCEFICYQCKYESEIANFTNSHHYSMICHFSIRFRSNFL